MSLSERVGALASRVASEFRKVRSEAASAVWVYRVSLGNLGTGAGREQEVIFPPGLFSSSPIIIAQGAGTSAGASRIDVTLRRWDASGCTVYVANNGATGTNVWLTLAAYRG